MNSRGYVSKLHVMEVTVKDKLGKSVWACYCHEFYGNGSEFCRGQWEKSLTLE